MKNLTHLLRSILAVISASLLITACSVSLPKNTVEVGSTPTPTAPSGSSMSDPTATIIPPEPPSPVALTPVQRIDVCSLLTAADAEPIVGTALIDLTPGSDIDEVTGGPLDYCTYKGDDVALVISLVMSSAIEGSQEWQDQLLQITQSSEPDAAITPASGLGERSYWVVTEDSAGWFVAKFPYVFALVVGGNIGYSEDYKEDLKVLAEKVIASLP